MHLIGVRNGFRSSVPVSYRSGLRPLAPADSAHLWSGGESLRVSAALPPGSTIIHADWSLHVVEVEDLQPRLLWILIGSKMDDLSRDELLALHHVAGTCQLTSLDELPLIVGAPEVGSAVSVRTRDLEIRAAQMRERDREASGRARGRRSRCWPNRHRARIRSGSTPPPRSVSATWQLSARITGSPRNGIAAPACSPQGQGDRRAARRRGARDRCPWQRGSTNQLGRRREAQARGYRQGRQLNNRVRSRTARSRIAPGPTLPGAVFILGKSGWYAAITSDRTARRTRPRGQDR